MLRASRRLCFPTPAAVIPAAVFSAAPAAPARWSWAARPTLLAIGVGICGCNLDSNFSDLGEKLLDPDVQGFDTPGQRLLSGNYFDLSIQADAAGARYALARDEEGELSVVNFAAKTQCRTASVARYGNAVAAPAEAALIPLILLEGSGTPELGFSSLDCELLPFRVPTGSLPIDVVNELPEGSGTSLLIRTPEQGLALIDPWQGSSRALAGSVRGNDPMSAFGHFLWVDGGAIVISDPALKPLRKYGTGVVELTLSTRGAELAYIETSGGASGTLYVVDALGSREPEPLADDVCNLRYLSIGRRLELAYFSPCAERRLVLRDRDDDSTLVIADGVASGPVVHNINDQVWLSYVTTSSQDTATGTLWMRGLEADAIPTPIAENARGNLSTVTPDGGGLLTMLEWSNTGGRLVEWRGDELTDVADRVVEIAPLGMIAKRDLTLLGNFDGVTGDLMRLNEDLTLEVLANGVPTRSASDDAFLANFDGSQGELRLFNRDDGSSELIGTGVSRGSFKFAQQFKGVMMLTDRDPETNTSAFQVRLLDSGQDFLLNTGVTEAREVAFPSPGFLYNVITGDKPGVYFSKTL